MSEPDEPRLWRSLEERAGRAGEPEVDLGTEPSWDPLADARLDRRSFLKAAGFFLGSSALSACARAPGSSAVPRLVASEDAVPGKAEWYATACQACPAACGALVKVRDGRPIKLEGDPGHPLSRGGLCAAGQASLLGLYDSRRLEGPLVAGSSAGWEAVDRTVAEALAAARAAGRSVRVLTSTVHSPSLRRGIAALLASRPGGPDPGPGGRHPRESPSGHVAYDALSVSAILDAHGRTHGRRALPRYRFDQAEVIASIGADFLGAWISPVEHAAGWARGRVPKGSPPRMSYHAQYEARMSLTGTSADRRVALAPGGEASLAAHLAQALSKLAGAPRPYDSLPPCPLAARELDDLSGRLWSARGKALVVCGANDLAAQAAVNHANQLLGAYGSTLDLRRPSQQRQGDDGALAVLLEELRAGKVGVLFVHGANPVAELPAPEGGWETVLAGAGLVVTTATHWDETAKLSGVVAPDHHFLESWLDAEPARGVASLVQPAIRPFGRTRSALESFAAWAGAPEAARELVRGAWRERGWARTDAEWERAVHDGTSSVAAEESQPAFDPRAAATLPPVAPPGGFAVVLYAKPGLPDGRHAQNPWLQELPDPVTKVVWDNYVQLSPATAAELGAREGDVVRVSIASASLELPAHVQPGQHDSAVCVALGYGREGTQRFHDVGPRWLSGKPTVPEGGKVGVNAAPLLAWTGGRLGYVSGPAALERTGREHPLACTQAHHTLEVPARLAAFPGESRDIVRETTLAELAESPSAGNPAPHPAESLWPKSDAKDRRWAMAVDLNLCNGCSACVVACQAENNVPVVGKDEVGRRRDMAWLRIDRYYVEDSEGVRAAHQPMLCQQCGNAPCETVCPVVATAGSEDGLNQQVYNRCVGTRYCANNCPYKTRRFNWFAYRKGGEREDLALNPDVTIRSRGVMEKCSFCVQRLQEAKIEAKRLGGPLADGAARTACQQSCPTQAIVFGDAHDPASRIAASLKDPRRYRVLEELHVDPAVGYLTKVRNRPA